MPDGLAVHAPEPATRSPAPDAAPVEAPVLAPKPDRAAVQALAGSRGAPAGSAAGAPRPERAAAIRPSDLVLLQRLAGNQAVTALVGGRAPRPPAPTRDADEGEGDVSWLDPIPADPARAMAMLQRLTVQRNPGPPVPYKHTIKIPDIPLYKFGETSYVKGEVKLTGSITYEMVDKKGQSPSVQVGSTSEGGATLDWELAKQKVNVDLLGGWKLGDITEKFNFELSKKQINVGVTVEAPVEHEKHTWVKGTLEAKGIGLSAEWEKVKENPRDISAGAIEVSGNIAGNGIVPVSSEYDVKIEVKAGIAASVGPNWTRIGLKAAEQVGKGLLKGAAESTAAAAATEAGTVLVVDAAAVASAAAAIVLPLAVAAMCAAGAWQEAKNTAAAREAAQAGHDAREKAKKAAEGYAHVMMGGRPKGDPGSTAAETQILAIMGQTHAERKDVIEAIKREKGYYDAIYQAEYKRILDVTYPRAVQIYEESHQADFGLLESLGEEWGMRGVYRSTLRLILYLRTD